MCVALSVSEACRKSVLRSMHANKRTRVRKLNRSTCPYLLLTLSEDKRPMVLDGFLYSRLENLVYCGAMGDPQSAVIPANDAWYVE